VPVAGDRRGPSGPGGGAPEDCGRRLVPRAVPGATHRRSGRAPDRSGRPLLRRGIFRQGLTVSRTGDAGSVGRPGEARSGGLGRGPGEQPLDVRPAEERSRSRRLGQRRGGGGQADRDSGPGTARWPVGGDLPQGPGPLSRPGGHGGRRGSAAPGPEGALDTAGGVLLAAAPGDRRRTRRSSDPGRSPHRGTGQAAGHRRAGRRDPARGGQDRPAVSHRRGGPCEPRPHRARGPLPPWLGRRPSAHWCRRARPAALPSAVASRL
jgi:hypothetical protein